jgi:MoaA/NifB/PqqE/SkfB family radical SAM enzyme
MVCFRVTRFCNARCGFCLAPPDGGQHPSAELLKTHIDWLLARGVKTIHFCGGEPTIHKELSQLIAHVRNLGGKCKLTTNGIAVGDPLIATLRDTRTEVKVSLHGDREHHDVVVGCDAFTRTAETIRRLMANRVSMSIQTTIVAGHLDVVPWMIRFCREHRVPRVSFLPFIPRGSGFARRGEYALSAEEKRSVQRMVREARRACNGHLEVRLLDFNARPIHVVEPDGRVVLEGATEAMDVVLTQIKV